MSEFVNMVGATDFSNIVYMAAGTFIAISGTALALLYLGPILLALGPAVVELMAYLALGSLVYYSPDLFPEAIAQYVALIFALGLSATSSFTVTLHIMPTGPGNSGGEQSAMNLCFFVNLIFYIGCAIRSQSKMFGFMAVMCFMGLIGFNVFLGSNSFGFGYREKQVVPSATVTAMIVILGGVFLKYNHVIHSELFVDGMQWVGCFVFFIGVLIMSSSYWVGSYDVVYFNTQIIALVVFLVPLYYGHTWEIPAVSTMTGVFLVFYLASKYAEMASNMGVAANMWCVLFLGLVSFFGTRYWQQNNYTLPVLTKQN
jgi:hypothetical protein